MTYDLAIGDRAYSSWSLRGWLLFDAFGLPVRVRRAQIYTQELPDLLADFAPAVLVPACRLPDGTVVSDTLAIAETLAERHPDAGIWPADPALRATARMLAAEMHSGFAALRSACPMNLRAAWQMDPVPEAVQKDLDRLERIWNHARSASASTTPWLFGDYCATDAFFAPVAARIAGYGLAVSEAAQAYVAAQLSHASVRRWRAMGQIDGPDQPVYDQEFERIPWTLPFPIATARAVDAGPSVNATCPYSGKPVTDFLELDGRIYGFCNPFCRDKTVADPMAWPNFEALVAQSS